MKFSWKVQLDWILYTKQSCRKAGNGDEEKFDLNVILSLLETAKREAD